MPSSGIIDLAIGLSFVFGVTAALSSAITEAISRFLGLRGAFLLLGLRELLDGDQKDIDLSNAKTDFDSLRNLTRKPPRAAAQKAPAADPGPAVGTPAAGAPAEGEPQEGDPTSATGALLGSPLLRSQGVLGTLPTRKLAMKKAPGNNAGGPDEAPGNNAGESKNAVGKAVSRLKKAVGVGKRRTVLSALPRSTESTGMLKRGSSTRRERRSLPAYISPRSFAEAIVDLMVPNSRGQTTMTAVQASIDLLPDSLGSLRGSLTTLASSANGDINTFRTMVEHWYDDHMSRVSGWYKRHVAWITLIVGAVLVLLLNINTITIGRALYSNSVVGNAVSAVAVNGTACPASQNQGSSQGSSQSSSQGKAGTTQQDCLARLEGQLASAAQAGLPIGWGPAPACVKPVSCNLLERLGIINPKGGSVWQFLLVLLGFLLTIMALIPGARFWFGLLSRLGSLRSSGPPPAPAAGSAD